MHSKKEQSHESNPGSFGFEWRLKLSFDPKMETLFPTLNIIDFDWGANLSEECKAEITNLTYSLIDSDAMYRQISQKSFDQLPVAKDMLEIVDSEGFSIVDQISGQVFFQTSKDRSLRKNLLKFLTHLAFLLDGTKLKDQISKRAKKLMPESEESITSKAQLQENLKILLESGPIPPTSNTMKVIKSLRSEVVTPAYRKLRRAFPQEFPVTYVPDSWAVTIILKERNIIVCHSKREKGSEGHQSSGLFEFKWTSSFLFDQWMNPIGSDLKIVEYQWDKKMKKENKRRLRQIWAPFVEWQAIEASAVDYSYLSAAEILRVVCATLDRQPEHLFPHHLTEQLKQLNDKLKISHVPLVVIPTSTSS